MARHQNRNRIRAARAAHGADGLGPANRRRDFAVAFRFAGGNFPQRVPDAFLEFRSRQIQRRKFFRLACRREFFSAPRQWRDASGEFWQGRRAAASCGRQCRRATDPAFGKSSSGQAFFRIVREKNSVARGNGQFDERSFHVSDVSGKAAACRAGSQTKPWPAR